MIHEAAQMPTKTSLKLRIKVFLATIAIIVTTENK